MQYIIMLLLIIGLALADYITGLIKAYCKGDICSRKMRIGGLNKLAEIIVMTVSCGLDIGINALGKYYNMPEISAFAGNFTASLVFVYIAVMEVVSIIENYAEINPDAKWTIKIIRRLKGVDEKDDDGQK